MIHSNTNNKHEGGNKQYFASSCSQTQKFLFVRHYYAQNYVPSKDWVTSSWISIEDRPTHITEPTILRSLSTLIGFFSTILSTEAVTSKSGLVVQSLSEQCYFTNKWKMAKSSQGQKDIESQFMLQHLPSNFRSKLIIRETLRSEFKPMVHIKML